MKKLPALLLLLFIFSKVNSQAPAIQWQKSFGGSSYEAASIILATADGGYLLAGDSYSNNNTITGNHGEDDIVLIKTDASGNISWQKSYGGSSYESCTGVKQTADGGYIVLGNTGSTNGDVSGNHGNGDMWLFKTNALGTLQWQKCLGGTDGDLADAVKLTADSGFIVIGSTRSNNGDVSGNHGGYDVAVLKLSATGSVQWQKCYGGSYSEFGGDIIATGTGFIFAGQASSADGDVSGVHGYYTGDFWVVRVSNTGSLLWQKCYGSNTNDGAENIAATPDGGYLVSGFSDTSRSGDFLQSYGDADARLVKINSTGGLEWTKAFGGNKEEEAKAQLTSDGGCLIYGLTVSNNNGDVSGYNGGSNDAWLAKVNSNGTLQWQRCLGNTGAEYIGGMVETADMGYMFVGTFTATGGMITVPAYGSDDLWMIKMAPDSARMSRQICPGGSVNLVSNVSGIAYQWQISTDGFSFVNLLNGSNATGVTTDTLHLTNIPSSWYGYQFKCVVAGNSSAVYTITFENRWAGSSTTAPWENPANWSCGSVPDANTDVVINGRTVVLSSNTTIRSLRLSSGAVLTVAPGFQLTITH